MRTSRGSVVRRAGWRRIGLRRSGAAVSALVLTAGLASAVGATGAVAADGPSPAIDELVGERSSAAATPQVTDPEGGRRGALKLDSSRTLRAPDRSAAPRQPALVKREATLWMSSFEDGPPSDAQELRTVEVLQDVPAKKVTVTARYYDVPSASANSALFVWFGTWDAEEENCSAAVQLAGIAASGNSGDAAAISMDNTSAGTATRALSSDGTLTVTWTGGRATEQNYSCVYASSYVVNGSDIGGEIERGFAESFDATYEQAPAFDFYASDLNAAYPGKWNKVYVNVRNEGDATASGVTLTGKGAKLKLRKKKVSLGNIAPGKSKSVNLQVKLRGKKIRNLNLTAKAKGNWSASSRTKVGFRPNPKRLKKLAGRSFWASPKESYSGWNVQQLTFVNKRWVFEGIPKSGYPTKCAKKTKGCKRYTYNARKKLLRIGKLRAKVDSEGIRTKGKNKVFYTPLQKPKANLRSGAKLSYYDYTGCEGSFSCSTWWRHLTLKKDGTFTWTYEAIHSSGMPPNQVFVSVSGPDKAGKYQFLSRGRLRINFVDEETGASKTEVFSVGIDHDALGRHGVDKGLLIRAMPHTP